MSTEDMPSVESLVRPALALAVLLAALQLLVNVVSRLLNGTPLTPFRTVGGQVVGVLGEATLIAVLLAVITVGTTMTVVKWGSIALYGVGLVQSVLFDLVYGFSVGLGTLFDPLSTVLLFLAVVAAVRTYRGETVLPGVEYTLDVEALRVERQTPVTASPAGGVDEPDDEPFERSEPR
ncbi:hypothetical protein [Haloglomus litoreum]|uniref:hypothetical protein n=1 Tax=Haloglomus litoreum TaxID=3034026 RepID=UPI0023E8DF6C|nr:hypothetical protein [Haloglomus sp. DT116]